MQLGQTTYPAGPPGFVAWLRDSFPKVYEQVKVKQPALVTEQTVPKFVAPVVKQAAAKKVKTVGRRKTGNLSYEGYNYDTGNYLLYGLGQDTATPAEKSTLETWADKLANLATPLLNIYQQKEMVDLQIERAKQGLPPLADDALAAKVKVTTGFDKYIPWVIGGGVALVGLMIWKK